MNEFNSGNGMATLKDEISKFLVGSMQAEQIRHTAERFLNGFDVRRFAGVSRSIALTKRNMAEATLDYLGRDEAMLDFVSQIIRLDGLGAGSTGRLNIRNQDQFKHKMKSFGWIFNPHTMLFEKDQSRVKTRDWGVLRKDKSYYLSFVDIDMAKSSELAENLDVRTLSDLFHSFRLFSEELVHRFDGRIWEWNGDGFVAAFRGTESSSTAFQFALSYLRRLVLFQYRFGRLESGQMVQVRIGADYGDTVFNPDNPTENQPHVQKAENLQRNFTSPGGVSTSSRFYQSLPPEAQDLFIKTGKEIEFEATYTLKDEVGQ